MSEHDPWSIRRNDSTAVIGPTVHRPHALRYSDGQISHVVAWLDDDGAALLRERMMLLDPALPEGVHQAPDGTLIWLSDETETAPVGWEVVLDGEPFTRLLPARWYEVRPIPKPETERVPLHKVIGCVLPACDWTVAWLHVGPGGRCTAYAITGDDQVEHHFTVSADGTVEVVR